MTATYLMCPEAARHEVTRRLRAADDESRRRMARRSTSRLRFRISPSMAA